MHKNIFISILLLAGFFQSHAQQDLSLVFCDNVFSNYRTNPAVTDTSRFVLSTSFYTGVYSSTGFFDDLLETTGNENLRLDVPALLAAVEPNNILNTDVELETISIKFRPKSGINIFVNHAYRIQSHVNFPDKLVKLIYEGNAQYIDQTIDIGPALNASAYNEFGIGASAELGDLTFGAKVNLLFGSAFVETERSTATLYTDPDVYQLEIETDYVMHTSKVVNYDSVFHINANQLTKGLLVNNNGFSFDLGLQYKVNDRFRLGASMLDLGSIKWKKDKTQKISSNIQERFEGVEINFVELLTEDSVSYGNELDYLSFDEVFEVETVEEEYKLKLPMRILLNAKFQLTKNIELGALYQMRSYLDETEGSYAFSARTSLLKDHLQFGVVYSNQFGVQNFGVNLAGRLGPVQIFALTDHLPGLFGSGNLISGRAGINLKF